VWDGSLTLQPGNLGTWHLFNRLFLIAGFHRNYRMPHQAAPVIGMTGKAVSSQGAAVEELEPEAGVAVALTQRKIKVDQARQPKDFLVALFSSRICCKQLYAADAACSKE
jgi:hypothetical protein